MQRPSPLARVRWKIERTRGESHVEPLHASHATVRITNTAATPLYPSYDVNDWLAFHLRNVATWPPDEQAWSAGMRRRKKIAEEKE